MKTKHFLVMATLAVGIVMSSMMMTSCAKEDNPIDNATDGPSVLPAGVLLQDYVIYQYKWYDSDEWSDNYMLMQFRVLDKLWQNEFPTVKLTTIFNHDDLDYRIIIPDSVVGYKGEVYKVVEANIKPFQGFISNLVELQSNHYIETIKEGLFSNCDKLKKAYLPEGAKIIMKKAFKGCYSLEELHLPRGLIKIDKNAFEGCENLKYVITHNIDPHNYQRWLPDGVELFDEESWKRRNQGD